MTDAPKPYQRRILELAAEANPNNARVPDAPGKGYLECEQLGWIERRQHQHGDYAYFVLTAAGAEALTRPSPKPAKRRTGLKPLPSRLGELPERLRPLKR